MQSEKKSWKFIDKRIKPILHLLDGSKEENVKAFLQDLKNDNNKEELRKKIAKILAESPEAASTRKFIEGKFRNFNTKSLEEQQACSKGARKVNHTSPKGKSDKQMCSGGPVRNAASSNRKDPTKQEQEKWSQLKPSNRVPLRFVNTGEEAKPIDIKAPTLATERGYHICNLHEMYKIMEDVATDSLLQITFVIHKLPEKDFSALKNHVLEKIKERAAEQKQPITLNLGIDEAQLTFWDPSRPGELLESKPCALIHMDKDDKIMPDTHNLASINFQKKDTTTVQLSIIEPICREMDLNAWFKEITRAEGKYEAYRKLITDNFIELTKFAPPKPPSVKRNTHLRWRGQEIEGGRITAFFDVPEDKLQEILSKSGACGTIIDMPGAEEFKRFDYVKVKLQTNLSMKQAIDKIKALPVSLRNQARGIVPTFKGYAVRVPRAAEAEITAALDPELAATMHRALGMQNATQWKLTGIPRHVPPSAIHNTFANKTPEWGGWIVRPIKTIGTPKNGKCDWLVEATEEPPKRLLIVNQTDIVTIEKHEEMQRVSHRLRGWEKIFADKTSQPKSTWADKVKTPTIHHNIARGDAQDKDDQTDPSEPQSAAMEVDTTAPKAAMDVDQVGERPAEKKNKRGPPAEVEEPKPNNDNDLIAFLKDQAERAQKQIDLKDEQIKTLMAQISNLTQEVKALREDVKAARTPVGADRDENL